MNLLQLFQECVNRKYIHVENSGDYSIERDGDSLYIYLECSNGIEDWKNNFNFPAKPYRRMGRAVWFAHRGFLKVWKSIEKYIEPYVQDETVKMVTVVGYSHGAALAVFCHEYIWYHRPDLRSKLFGYGFGCPRAFWGIKRKRVKQRWERFIVIRNIDDIVTHVPPSLLGFSHVGSIMEIGQKGTYNSIDAHRPDNIMTELEIIESLEQMTR